MNELAKSHCDLCKIQRLRARFDSINRQAIICGLGRCGVVVNLMLGNDYLLGACARGADCWRFGREIYRLGAIWSMLNRH